jgi:hypothetical protein
MDTDKHGFLNRQGTKAEIWKAETGQPPLHSHFALPG